MKSTATRAQNPDNTMGYGLIDLEKCLARLLNGQAIQLSNFNSYSAPGLNVLTWTANSMLAIKEWIIERQTVQPEFSELGRLEVPAGQQYPENLSFVDLDISGGETCRYRLQVELTGGEKLILDSLEVLSLLSARSVLYQNFPNPFNTGTQIIFSLDHPQKVSLTVYDRTGRLVRVLIEHMTLPASFHHYTWDGKLASGSPVASGIYYIVLSAGPVWQVVKSVFLK